MGWWREFTLTGWIGRRFVACVFFFVCVFCVFCVDAGPTTMSMGLRTSVRPSTVQHAAAAAAAHVAMFNLGTNYRVILCRLGL